MGPHRPCPANTPADLTGHPSGLKPCPSKPCPGGGVLPTSWLSAAWRGRGGQVGRQLIPELPCARGLCTASLSSCAPKSLAAQAAYNFARALQGVEATPLQEGIGVRGVSPTSTTPQSPPSPDASHHHTPMDKADRDLRPQPHHLSPTV